MLYNLISYKSSLLFYKKCIGVYLNFYYIALFRTKNGVVPPLATRATLAAWPSSGSGVSGQTNSSTSHGTAPVQAHDHGVLLVSGLINFPYVVWAILTVISYFCIIGLCSVNGSDGKPLRMVFGFSDCLHSLLVCWTRVYIAVGAWLPLHSSSDVMQKHVGLINY